MINRETADTAFLPMTLFLVAPQHVMLRSTHRAPGREELVCASNAALRSTWRQRDTQWLDYETGVRAAQEFVDLVGKLPFDATPAQAALAWVVQQEGVTTVAPAAISEDVSASSCTMSPPLLLGPLGSVILTQVDLCYGMMWSIAPVLGTDGNDLLVVHCC